MQTSNQDSSQDLAGLRVLVVDDNHDAADSLAQLVESEGAKTRVAYSAAEAFDAIEQFNPGVMLLDIGMPVMDGYAACRRVRATHGKSIVIVAVTGRCLESDKKLAQLAGFDAHLTKPADARLLTETIAKFRKPN